MPTLYLLRHAKSSWDDFGLRDFDRPLAPRGLKVLPSVARLVLSLELPQRIVCSPARRAIQTAEGVQKCLVENGHPIEIFQNENIYGADSDELVEIVRGFDPQWSRVMMVGHNPGFEDLAAVLCSHGGIANLRFPTAALAQINLTGASWSAAGPGMGSLYGFYPARIVRKFDRLDREQ